LSGRVQVPAASARIRRGVPGDAFALAEFASRTFSETFGAENWEDDLEQHLKSSFGPAQQGAELIDPDTITLLAEAEGKFAAFAQVRRSRAPECVTGVAPVELWRFYVDRPWQGRGLAQRLMASVREVSVELGGRTLWLGVWEHNPRAIAFYQKCGFRDVGSHDFWLGGDQQTDRVMVTALG
jgi:ribosomal protein S18 acetylase RimI-like enzyme